jgi:sulfatase maturation enzyme AslB (radical SAM superfamily)
MTAKPLFKQIPDYYTFYMTFRCNLACRMCYQDSLRRQAPRELKLQEIIAMFDRIKDLSRVNLIGGEVFVRPDILPLLEYFDSRAVQTYITSNGTLLDSQTIDRLLRLRRLLGVTVSLDALDEAYRALRGTGTDPAAVLNHIKELAQGTEVRVNSVLLQENLHGFAALIPALSQAGVSLLKVQLQIAHSPWVTARSAAYCTSWLGQPVSCLYGSERISWDPAVLERAIRTIRDLGRQYRLPVLISPPELTGFLEEYSRETLWMNRQLRCEGEKQIPRLKILPHGDAIFCEGLNLILGNLREHTPGEILNSPVLRTFLDHFNRLGGLPICQRCCRVVVGPKRGKPLS